MKEKKEKKGKRTGIVPHVVAHVEPMGIFLCPKGRKA